MRTTTAWPPGHPRREQLRQELRGLPAASVRISFESLAGHYRLLGYRTGPERRQLTDTATRELRMFAMAVICEALPKRPLHDRKRGRLVWDLATDRCVIGY